MRLIHLASAGRSVRPGGEEFWSQKLRQVINFGLHCLLHHAHVAQHMHDLLSGSEIKGSINIENGEEAPHAREVIKKAILSRTKAQEPHITHDKIFYLKVGFKGREGSFL